MSKELKTMILELTSGLTEFQKGLFLEVVEHIAEDHSNRIVQKSDDIINLVSK